MERWKKDYDARNKDNSLDLSRELLNFYKEQSDFHLALYNAGLSHIIMDTAVSSAAINENDPNPLANLKSSLAYMIYGWVHEWMKRGM